MAAIGRARRKRPEKPVVVELDMPPQTEGAARNDVGKGGAEARIPTTMCLSRALPVRRGVPPALPHLGIFAVEPDNRARELLHFSMIESPAIGIFVR